MHTRNNRERGLLAGSKLHPHHAPPSNFTAFGQIAGNTVSKDRRGLRDVDLAEPFKVLGLEFPAILLRGLRFFYAFCHFWGKDR